MRDRRGRPADSGRRRGIRARAAEQQDAADEARLGLGFAADLGVRRTSAGRGSLGPTADVTPKRASHAGILGASGAISLGHDDRACPVAPCVSCLAHTAPTAVRNESPGDFRGLVAVVLCLCSRPSVLASAPTADQRRATVAHIWHSRDTVVVPDQLARGRYHRPPVTATTPGVRGGPSNNKLKLTKPAMARMDAVFAA